MSDQQIEKTYYYIKYYILENIGSEYMFICRVNGGTIQANVRKTEQQKKWSSVNIVIIWGVRTKSYCMML